MASPQADCRGVAAEAVAFQASFERIRAYAGELLDFAEREYARLPVHRTCELPDASLEIGFSAAEFAELCDRVIELLSISFGGFEAASGRFLMGHEGRIVVAARASSGRRSFSVAPVFVAMRAVKNVVGALLFGVSPQIDIP